VNALPLYHSDILHIATIQLETLSDVYYNYSFNSGMHVPLEALSHQFRWSE
jgi:hypothetical protein